LPIIEKVKEIFQLLLKEVKLSSSVRDVDVSKFTINRTNDRDGRIFRYL